MFQKWISWCQEQNSNPVSCPVSEEANFLADLFDKGYSYGSLNSYAQLLISSAGHARVEGVSVGQHPIISHFMAGAFNSRPPQPRYSST